MAAHFFQNQHDNQVLSSSSVTLGLVSVGWSEKDRCTPSHKSATYSNGQAKYHFFVSELFLLVILFFDE